MADRAKPKGAGKPRKSSATKPAAQDTPPVEQAATLDGPGTPEAGFSNRPRRGGNEQPNFQPSEPAKEALMPGTDTTSTAPAIVNEGPSMMDAVKARAMAPVSSVLPECVSSKLPESVNNVAAKTPVAVVVGVVVGIVALVLWRRNANKDKAETPVA